MKNRLLPFLCVPLVLAFASCKSVQKSHTADYDYLFITKQGIIQKPLVADLDVAKQKSTLTKTYDDVTLSQAKENIMADFIKENNCDLIVQPYFSSSSTSSVGSSKITITVNGYPASYRNIRQFERKDTMYFLPSNYLFHSSAKAPITAQEVAAPAKKKSKAGLIVGSILLVGALSYALAHSANNPF
ncbi:MAG: hypothetical protein EOO15_11560 [Chitinophagaceae bacterium]|nr:MAG: hypothetical protein EOO15_11560 [Chitinophagaceae bacterium]